MALSKSCLLEFTFAVNTAWSSLADYTELGGGHQKKKKKSHSVHQKKDTGGGLQIQLSIKKKNWYAPVEKAKDSFTF